jgi:hypothetical protein
LHLRVKDVTRGNRRQQLSQGAIECLGSIGLRSGTAFLRHGAIVAIWSDSRALSAIS